jgi:predicted dehydrogenase
LLGTGIAARELHWPALRQLSDLYQIVAVGNRSLPKAEAFAELIGLDLATCEI